MIKESIDTILALFRYQLIPNALWREFVLYTNRPTHKELTNKIRLAIEAIQKQPEILIVEPLSCAVDALELGYSIKEELYEIVAMILNEITADQYFGERPP